MLLDLQHRSLKARLLYCKFVRSKYLANSVLTSLVIREDLSMAKIWFGRPGAQPDQGDLKGEKEISWCKNNVGPLTFLSAPGRLPKMPDEESSLPPPMRNYRFVVVEIEDCVRREGSRRENYGTREEEKGS
jgi:hypothetical protein